MTTEKTNYHYIVQTAKRKTAVLKVERQYDKVSSISERAKGCLEIVNLWENGDQKQARISAVEIAATLNLAELMAQVIPLDVSNPFNPKFVLTSTKNKHRIERSQTGRR